MLRFLFLAVALLPTMSPVLADIAPARVAVIGDGDDKNLAALLTTELSANAAIALVERDDLAKIGDELKLQQLAGKDAVALGKLAGADGLLFIDKRPDGTHVRFTAVNLGYALFDDPVEAGADLPQEAKALAHIVANDAPKLKLDPTQAIPISVLNLRADYATAASVVLERKLTLLLESRLAALPQYVVLERRHAWSLGFEHSLSTDDKPLLQGACLVDGTLSMTPDSAGATDTVVHLRLRSPGREPTSREIHGSSDDLPALVEKITDEIRKTMGGGAQTATWDSQKEAREYLDEGVWGWEHGADDAAVEALDSAELLGEKAPDLVPIRISVLLDRAGKALEAAKKEASSSSDPMIDDTLRAITDAARYDAEKLEGKLQLFTWEQHMDVRTDQIKENLANFASELLATLDERHSNRADELRKALRAVTGYDPLHGKLGRDDMSNPLNVMTDSRGEWPITEEEALAGARLLATLPHQFIPPGWLTGQGKDFLKRFYPTPEEQKAAFDKFVGELQGDAKGQVAYQLIRSCSSDPAVADDAYTAYWQEMWNKRDELVTQKVQVEEWTSARPVPKQLRQKHAKEMIPLLRYYLTHVDNYRDWEYSWDTFWQPDQWSKDDAAAIWSDYLGFRQRAKADHRARGYGDLDLAEIEDPFAKQFPELVATIVPAAAKAEPLVVHRLWHPEPPVGGSDFGSVIITRWVKAGDKLWVLAWYPGHGKDRHVLFEVSLPDFHAVAIATPDAKTAGDLAATPDAVYLRYAFGGPNEVKRLARYDLKSESWEVRPLDIAANSFYAVGDLLYFDLKSGIESYNWSTGETKLLASSRRKPAQNQFDDREEYQIQSIFAGPGGKPCVNMLEDGTHYIQDTPGPWPEVFDSGWWTGSTTRQDTTLIYAPEGEIVLLDPRQPEPQYLLAPDKPLYRKIAKIHHAAVKEKTPWAAKALWDAAGVNYWSSFIGGDAQRLFVMFRRHEDDPYQLRWFDREHGRTSHTIPLRFAMDEDTFAALPDYIRLAKDDRLKRTNLENPGYRANLSLGTDEDGIFLCCDDLGFWSIPYADIESYLKKHSEEEQASAPPVATDWKIPPPEDDAQSRVIGDMIDPVMRAVSFR
jgi:hypothetical protein